MAFGLLIVGDEILSGKRSDKHFSKVIELLGARGLALSWMRCVGDERSRITADLKDAFASGDVVFSCGGIGATPDDHTRQCAADALGRPELGDAIRLGVWTGQRQADRAGAHRDRLAAISPDGGATLTGGRLSPPRPAC
jgi:molybdopterin-biosynthesis enzyme MoeA-like protein